MPAHVFARSVHVVFGSVISGFEVIKKIEGLKTDSASRPYADVRVIDCGQLITKSANDGNPVKKQTKTTCCIKHVFQPNLSWLFLAVVRST